MSPSSSCFSFGTWSATLPVRTVELPHLGSSEAEDTTYLGMLFSLSAHLPLRDSHRAANHASLRRPSSRASAPSASSSASWDHASRSLPPNWPNQPPSLKPSAPSGSWTTPSSETVVLITIFPMSVLPFAALSATTDGDTAIPGKRRPPAAPFASSPVSIQQARHDAGSG